MVNQCPVRHTKTRALQKTIHLMSRDSKQTSWWHWSSKRTPAAAQNTPKRPVRGKRQHSRWENKQGREFSIDWLHATTSDVQVSICLLIMAQTPHCWMLLCHQVPGTICWLLCEKIGQTRANHFPPNYPHSVDLLQAAWTGKRGYKGGSKGEMKDAKSKKGETQRRENHPSASSHHVNVKK